jgi:hypothetical protein
LAVLYLEKGIIIHKLSKRARFKMKKIAILFLLCSFAARSQDTLYYKNNTQAVVKIAEVNNEAIKYKKIDNPDGPNYNVNKSEIRSIHYSNGVKENVDSIYTAYKYRAPQTKPIEADVYVPNNSTKSMAARGRADAKKYYRHPGGSVLTALTTVLFPPVGLIPAYIFSNVPPRTQTLGYPSEELWENPDYREAYILQARYLRSRRVWIGFGTGLAGYFIIALSQR